MTARLDGARSPDLMREMLAGCGLDGLAVVLGAETLIDRLEARVEGRTPWK